MTQSKMVNAPSGGVFRIAARLDPFEFSTTPRRGIALEEPVYDGNRWDDPRGIFSVLYCATVPQGAFGETIARYRERQGLDRMIDTFLDHSPDDHYDPLLCPGEVPEDYFSKRYLGHAVVSADAKFVDVDDPSTHAACEPALLSTLQRFTRVESIDRSTMLSPDRRITQTVSRHFYELSETPDHLDLRGIRYQSRLCNGWECWAIWAPSPFEPDPDRTKVTREHPALLEAADTLSVQVSQGS